jgi:hypothetical protein
MIKEMYDNLKMIELREIARSRGLTGCFGFSKSNLRSFIEKREREVNLSKEEQQKLKCKKH